MNPRQQQFVAEYLIDLNATQAAIRAGYSAKTAGVIGDENLKKPYIADAVRKALELRAKRTEIDADYVLKTIFETVERCKQAEPVMIGGEQSGEYKFDANAVLKGCELLGKHFKMFTDKTEVTGANGQPISVNIAPKVSKDEWMKAHGLVSK